MQRHLLIAGLALAAVVVIWILASAPLDEAPAPETTSSQEGSSSTSAAGKTAKPICASPINPNIAAPTDCIPQHLAKLPPDPGPEGMKTIAGIDADGDGVRDDVQRYIAENWGHSERAIRALTNIAKARQAAVIAGDSVSREEAQALAQPMLNAGSCYILAGDQALKDTQALQKVAYKVMNTPERFKRGRDFEYKAGHTVYPLNQASTPQICGFDPAALPN